MLRPTVDVARLVNLSITVCVVLLVLSLLRMGSIFALIVLASALGAVLGFAVFKLREDRGLGASEVGEPSPDFAGRIGHINMAHIPVMGIGGLGIVAMSLVVAMVLPEGRTQLAWGIAGAVIGAGGYLAWRHHHGGTPFGTHPDETLHLR